MLFEYWINQKKGINAKITSELLIKYIANRRKLE